MKHFKIYVYGHVQGVGFRYFVKVIAERYNICGWVRNLDDGSVEIDSEGMAANMNAFLESVNLGNRYSSVEYIDTFPLNTFDNFRSFDIID